jgi:hypothetical protein
LGHNIIILAGCGRRLVAGGFLVTRFIVFIVAILKLADRRKAFKRSFRVWIRTRNSRPTPSYSMLLPAADGSD